MEAPCVIREDRPILCVVGARPNFMKIAPILRALRARGNKRPFRLVHTGQHYDDGMSGQLFRDLGLPVPDFNLEVGSGSHAVQTGEVMIRFDRVLDSELPACVLVVGDVNSTIACALVATKRQIPVLHVEAGLRSGDKSMPEEINRILTDQISSRLYTTERSAALNLIREGVDPHAIRFVGNVMIDTLIYNEGRFVSPRDTLRKFGVYDLEDQKQRYAVATFHRPSNVDCKDALELILTILRKTAEKLPVVFILHPRTEANVSRFELGNSLNEAKLSVLPPQGYLEMLGLMASAFFVLTDSGGIQEETTALGVPCLTLRENTERPVTVEQGTNTLLSLNLETVMYAVDDVFAGRGKHGLVPELWDGVAAERIVDDIFEFLG